MRLPWGKKGINLEKKCLNCIIIKNLSSHLRGLLANLLKYNSLENSLDNKIQLIINNHNGDRTRLVSILWDVQREFGYISDESIKLLGEGLNMSPLDVIETLSFYHFFRRRPFGKHVIYLCDTVIARMKGYHEVHDALEKKTGAKFGQVDPTGTFGIDYTNCIGLADQEPAMMVDDVVFTHLTPDKITDIIEQLKSGKTAEEVASPHCRDKTKVEYVNAIVDSNIHLKGEVFFKENRDYKALLKSFLSYHPDEIIDEVINSKIRGRGGAGFPTGLKWRFGREAEGKERYIICNADEGEPGTFKDRVLITESPKDILIGMILAAYSVESRFGIIYLRAEYWYLKAFLEKQIQDFRDEGMLGENILGSGLEFDIRIQMGAGAYVCGDETALIESCEGKRGTPRVKPPYPIQVGYLNLPTIVNNVETFAAVSRIVEEGGDWYAKMGTDDSTGTRILSASGDCERPGIYEIEWGMTLNEALTLIGAKDSLAVQVSGASGECAAVSTDGERELCYSDLSCNGSFMVFNKTRDILGIVERFMHFFVEESCGICTPCRAGCVDMLTKIERFVDGRGSQQDIDECKDWSNLMTSTARCGLGTTAARPILTTIEKFPELYQAKIKETNSPLLPSYDITKATLGHDEAFKKLIGES